MAHSEDHCVILKEHSYGHERLFTMEEAIKELDYDCFDNRKSYATHFYYCPYCGKKINWRRIRKFKKAFDKEYLNALARGRK